MAAKAVMFFALRWFQNLCESKMTGALHHTKVGDGGLQEINGSKFKYSNFNSLKSDIG